MDWMLTNDPDRDDAARVEELLERAQAELGSAPLEQTRFMYDASDMLRATRLIEDATLGVDTVLYVGFQTAGKLDGEHVVYNKLVGGGTTVHGFGVGVPHDDAGVHWHAVPDTEALVGQWFLVAEAPEPIAFVGFERSPSATRGVGGALDDSKTWAGFVSDDPRLVSALASHLADVTTGVIDGLGDAATADTDPASAGVTAAVQERDRSSHDGPLYLIATDDGSAELGAVRAEGLRRAEADGARVLLYDRSAESRLNEPYDIGPWGREEDGVGPATALEPDVLEGLGRRYLADQLRLVRAKGFDARVFMPRGTGVKALAEAVRRFGPDRIFLPGSMAEAGLVDRVTRNTLDDIDLGAADVVLIDGS